MRSATASPIAAAAQLLDIWQRQVADPQRDRSDSCGDRQRNHGPADPGNRQNAADLAVLGYLINGPVRGGFVPVEHLVLVVLQAPHSQSGLPLAGFSAERVEWGVAWGGADRNPFAKDLALEPQLAARGRRLDLTRSRLLELGLRLEHALHRAGRHPRLRLRRRFSLPPLWAAFRAADAAGLQGDGPEFSEAARMAKKKSASQLLAEAGRDHQGLRLFPLDWVSHRWRQAVDIFADLSRFPQRQAIRLRDGALDLVGYRGACQFNFHDSRFQQGRFQEGGLLGNRFGRRPPARLLTCA
jgi:hypothetical protein